MTTQPFPAISISPIYSFIDSSTLFEPFSVPMPSQSSAISVPQEVLCRLREDFWYGNMGADSVFEYRAVEVPMEIAFHCPNRNLTELECRSIGITQSPGWVNYWRQSSEKNVFLFRRPRVDNDDTVITERILSEIKQGIECVDLAHGEGTRDFLIFPMSVFDAPNVFPDHPGPIEISSPSQLAEWQRMILVKALEIMQDKVNN
jgi:cyclin-dependent kinase regulatory subunit CKS1